MRIKILLLIAIILLGCASAKKNIVFRGEILYVDIAPLAVDGAAEVDVKNEIGETQRIFVVSCNPPSPCNLKLIDMLTNGQISVGDRVEVSTYLWKYGNGEKFIVELPNGYIKKI